MNGALSLQLPPARAIASAAIVALTTLFWSGCASSPVSPPPMNPPPPMTPIPAPSQFDQAEAMAMVEFCLDLDSEDDRTDSKRRIYLLRADRSLNLWECIADSRGMFGANSDNPIKNGFPPFDSAWTLWRKKAPAANGTAIYALAFRGTVMANKKSVMEDALATTIAARYGLEFPAGRFLPLTFAALPGAEVHAGFAYGLLGALFDQKYGALRAVENHVPAGSTLIITGHSQGAGLATLAHAFFYYAAIQKQFGLAERKLALRSYVFAQPKPGNLQFSQDFAQVCGGGANSFVFNNTLDPVPMLPPTHLYAAEAFAELPGSNPGSRFARWLNRTNNQIRGAFSGLFEESIAGKIKKLQRRDGGFQHGEELRAGSLTSGPEGGSLSYTTAGNLIALPGFSSPSNYYNFPADANDAFVQHHASTYRRLLEIMYGYAPTTETSPELEAPPPHVRAEPGT